MIYCVSDIHGHYHRFLEMLEKIQFSDRDTLYILGDCIDRGSDGVALLEDIMTRPNVHMLLGNHEEMCLGAIGPRNIVGAKEIWQRNGGSATRRDLLYRRTPTEKVNILRFLLKLPDSFDLEVNGRKFHLVHGCPSDDHHTRLWGRPDEGDFVPIPGVTVILGHTPTYFLAEDKDAPLQIFHGDGFIDIDCGCGNQNPNCRLACLRLDDMAEFYVK